MPTQQQIADHLDLDQSVVSRLLAELGFDSSIGLDAVRIAYVRKLREVAAGRETELAAQRARLAKEQADRVAMQNAVTRKELAPVSVITVVIARVASGIVAILETLPVQLKRRSSLSADDFDFITQEIQRARALMATMEVNMDDLEFGDDTAAEDK